MPLTLTADEMVLVLDTYREKEQAKKFAEEKGAAEEEEQKKKYSIWEAFKKKSAKKHFSDACFVIGAFIGIVGALTFGFLYTTVLFTGGWPIAATIVVLVFTAIPSIVVEVLVLGVLKDNVGDVFRAVGETIWDAFTKKPNEQIKYQPFTWRDIFQQGTLASAITLNGAAMAFLSWVSLMLFLTGFGVSGAAIFVVPTVFALFLFFSSISFNGFLNRASFKRKTAEAEASVEKTHFEPEALLEKNAATDARNKKIMAWAFGVTAGTIVCLVTVISMFSLPFLWPVVIALTASIAIPHLITQVSSAKSGFYEFLEGSDLQSTKINAFFDHKRLSHAKENGSKLGFFEGIKLSILNKYPNAFVNFIFGSKWSLLILKGANTAIFTAMTLLTLGTLLGFAPPVGIMLAAVILAAVLSAAPDLINTALQNRAIFFNQKDDSKTIRADLYGALVETNPENKVEIQTYLQATYSEKSREPSPFEKEVNAFHQPGMHKLVI